VTAPTLPLYDVRALAAALRERGLPGARSMTALRNLRRDRASQRPPLAGPDLPTRLTAALTARAVAEIARRGGETVIENKTSVTRLAIADRDKQARLMLLHADGWRHYSNRFGARFATLSYLYGVDDAGPWAVRVPGTVTTVAAALAWITPAEVTAARVAGRRIARQGDVYAVETTRAHDGGGELPDAHTWDAAARTLTHTPQDGRAHAPLTLPYPVRFVTQRVYGMGRGAGRADGD
jgi:hypothetical protein